LRIQLDTFLVETDTVALAGGPAKRIGGARLLRVEIAATCPDVFRRQEEGETRFHSIRCPRPFFPMRRLRHKKGSRDPKRWSSVQVSLGGKSRSKTNESKQAFVDRTRQEREAREAERRRQSSATKIQASFAAAAPAKQLAARPAQQVSHSWVHALSLWCASCRHSSAGGARLGGRASSNKWGGTRIFRR